jgi:carbonic anhydrase/acetyltransferase-like protein (isoleucine patch superfamily)
MALVRSLAGKAPRLHESAFVVEGAVVIGDVELGAESSLWFGTVVRGDVNFIRIGARTNVQDHSVLHVTGGTHPTVVGDEVTVGHRVTLHGCTVKDRCLVGIGAIVLDGAVVEEEAMVGAGALVAPGFVVPSRTLVLGAPARVVRPLRAAEVEGLRRSADRYVENARRYAAEGWGRGAR